MQEEKADQRLRKEAQVTLYRNYRVGDFPDIQISYSSLITPLQALAQVRLPTNFKYIFKQTNYAKHKTWKCFLIFVQSITPFFLQKDPILAKQLFSSLFAGILQEIERQKPRESVKIKDELQSNMNMFLSKSTLCFPPFIACIQVTLTTLTIFTYLSNYLGCTSQRLFSTNCNWYYFLLCCWC